MHSETREVSNVKSIFWEHRSSFDIMKDSTQRNSHSVLIPRTDGRVDRWTYGQTNRGADSLVATGFEIWIIQFE